MKDVLGEVLLLFVVAVFMIVLFRRLKLPAVLGYLVAGILFGPHALGVFEDSKTVHMLGEIGIAFMLFVIGLEFSLTRFWHMRRILFGLGGVQVLVGTIFGGLIAWHIGISWPAVLIAGGALALSSTAVVIKQLTEQAELHSPHGRFSLGILLFQDVAAVIFLAMIPSLSAQGLSGSGQELLYALLEAILAFVVLIAIGRWLLEPLFREVCAANSKELFTLTVLLVSLFAAWFTYLMGFSLALGAFLAGMMLSETMYRHQIEEELRPFRDILLGLFFIVVGMQINLGALPDLWPWVILVFVGLLAGKGLLIYLLVLLTKTDRTTAMRTGLILAQGGEFGFALMTLAVNRGLLSNSDSQAILIAVGLSMLLAPILIRYSGAIASRFFPTEAVETEEEISDIVTAVSEITSGPHVVICGYGRVGRVVAHFLRLQDINFIALDRDTEQVRLAWEDGEDVLCADINRAEILSAVSLENSLALVISFNNVERAASIVRYVRERYESVPVLVRADNTEDMKSLLAMGATEVIPEAIELGSLVSRRLLLALGLSEDEVSERISKFNEDHHKLL